MDPPPPPPLPSQYLGTSTPPNVLKKIKELLYSWKIGLPNEPKIADAYEMLKKEGMVLPNASREAVNPARQEVLCVKR